MTDMGDSHYNDLWMHRTMLADRVRCEVYRQALSAWVKPGDVVLDVGAGTGILSLFAVQSGAAKAYAVERTGIVKLTNQLISINGVEDRVEVIRGDMETAQLPEKVDLIVSEWMGGYGVDEGFLPAVLIARDKWLKPDGKILPGHVTAWMAPAYDSKLEGELNFWRNRPYKLDLSLVADFTVNELFWSRHHITGDSLLATPQQMWSTDAYTCSITEARSPFKALLSFSITRKGFFNVLATWFRADFGKGILLTNAPDADKTHWGRFIFPLNRTIELQEGEIVSVMFACKPRDGTHCSNRWSIRIGNGDWEHHESND